MPYSDRYITLVRVGRIVTACAYITLTSNFNQVGNTSVNETIPEGFRPSGDSRAVMRGTDNSGATSFYLYGTADGKMVLNGTIMVVGGLSNGDRCMHTPRTLPIPDGVTFS